MLSKSRITPAQPRINTTNPESQTHKWSLEGHRHESEIPEWEASRESASYRAGTEFKFDIQRLDDGTQVFHDRRDETIQVDNELEYRLGRSAAMDRHLKDECRRRWASKRATSHSNVVAGE